MQKYDPHKIERKWQKYWGENKIFSVAEDSKKKKFYALIEFPYPSAAGLHVGHPRPFTAMDVISRKKRMEGYNVLYPIGFDAFGLPTENYAIKTGRPPAEVTAENIAAFTRQLKSLGYSFDWERAVNTTDPEYYRWTQWIFLQFFKNGLAYKKNQPINWCPKDKIGLANEEVVQGCCERCGAAVEQREKEQWMLAITKYADKLLRGLKEVDYIAPARIQQENWIGKSEGAEIDFALRFVSGQADDKHKVRVFTTRPDTIFGATFVAVSAELAQSWLKVGWQASEKVKKYIEVTLKERVTTADRDEQEKTGIDTGIKAVNPENGEEIPVWVTNYVMGGVGTGAIMGVPAHDQRDWEFVKWVNNNPQYKYDSPIHIKHVVEPDFKNWKADDIWLTAAITLRDGLDYKESLRLTLSYQYNELIKKEKETHIFCFTGQGKSINSSFLNGLATKEAKEKIIKWLEEKKVGKRKVNFKLRDWVFSRQRYWGEPIPLVFCENCKNKKQKVLLIHGFGGHDQENWFPWFKKELEGRGYEVFIPNLPDTNVPNLEKWVSALEKIPFTGSDEIIIIAHSLGGPTACKFIERKGIKIKKLILVAPVGYSSGMEHLKKYDFTTGDIAIIKKFGAVVKNVSKLKGLIEESVLIVSTDDPYIPPSVREDYKPLVDRERIFTDKGHFNEGAGITVFPEVLDEFPEHSGWVPLPESELPLKLPEVKKYQPTDTGESPLAAMEKWVSTKCPRCGGPARRETDTMPNWAGSSWYFLRYCDPNNRKEFATQETLKYWTPVDWYNGGMEHTVLHLLYSRFWNQFLYDLGLVPTREPYKRRTSHGMILGPDGEKMSKSRGNVINPDEMVEKFGADAFRMYIMFMGPFDQAVMWDTNGLVGMRRLLERFWSLQDKIAHGEGSALLKVNHQTIKKVSDDIDNMKFNTAIAQIAQWINKATNSKVDKIFEGDYEVLIKLLSPFAPHICEELWNDRKLFVAIDHSNQPLSYAPWPIYNVEFAKEAMFTVVIQVNGKVRDQLVVSAEISEEDIKARALASGKIQKWLQGKAPKKVIYVKGKLISIVI